MLIESELLLDNLDDVIIIDTRGKIPYSYAHIPNSIPLSVEDLMTFKNSTGYILEKDKAEIFLSKLGIDKNRKIILYGEYLDPSVARVYWSLLYYGYNDINILNLGFIAWARSNLPITRRVVKLDPIDLKLESNDDIIADAEFILDNKPKLIDSRSVQEYMQGKIPNSINIPWESNIEKDKIFADIDYITSNLKDIDGNIVCYCTHGIRAAHMFASLRLIGKYNVRVYDGSIMDWVSKKLPIE